MKILVGYDGSETSKAALELAKKHAEAFKGEVIAITSLMIPDTVQEKEAKESLEAAGKLFKDSSVPFSSEVLVGGLLAGEDIIRFARENDVDEIIIGVKKRSKVGKMLFGSTLQTVVLHAHCPVLTLK